MIDKEQGSTRTTDQVKREIVLPLALEWKAGVLYDKTYTKSGQGDTPYEANQRNTYIKQFKDKNLKDPNSKYNQQIMREFNAQTVDPTLHK
jgi:hypothetical protein